MAAEEEKLQSKRSRLTRDYPPFFLGLSLLVLLAVLLPNALRIPPQDPPQVLEYAPVPPQDNNQPNPNGNMSNLSLGSSSTLSEAGKPPPPPPPGASGDYRTAKHCYANRQTDDPNSPPCVTFFTGDNGGATWRGVKKDEIKAVVYLDTANYGGEGNAESSYAPGTYDIDTIPTQPCPKNSSTDPHQCAFNMVRAIRALAAYFNGPYGFQTYNRRVHFYVQIAGQNPKPQDRRNDAQDLLTNVSPFAVLDEASLGGFNAQYDDAVAGRQMMLFSSNVSAEPESFYRQDAPYLWGFWPDIEHWAKLYSSYLCQRVFPDAVVQHSGNSGAAGFNGQRRKYGVFYSVDQTHPSLQYFHDLVVKELQASNCATASTRLPKHPVQATFPYSGWVVDNEDSGADARKACTTFQSSGVTTVLYLGGTETQFSKQCSALSYYPEIFLAGDLENDGTLAGQYQTPSGWQNVTSVSYQLRDPRPQISPGYQAALKGDPNLDSDAATWAATLYRDFFMLFQAIQVAGPRISPSQVDAGFHAIPPKSSSDPFVASCFFDPGDYTCVKDAQIQWWDNQGQSDVSNQPGCWRDVSDGKRWLAGNWPKTGNADVPYVGGSNDPCNDAPSTGGIRPT